LQIGIRALRSSTPRFRKPCSIVKPFRTKPLFSPASRSWPIDGEGGEAIAASGFFIGAHAAVAGYLLMTRDAARYRTYFRKLSLIAPG
jgi:hypothetical protein